MTTRTAVATSIHTGGSYDDELAELRNRIVTIASRRRVSITEIISLGIVFSREELIAAANNNYEISSSGHGSTTTGGSASTPTAGPMVSVIAQQMGNLERLSSSNNIAASASQSQENPFAARRSQSRFESDVVTSRHRTLPPGHQLRPDLPPDADDAWIEDEERRQSIPAYLKKEFATTIKASAVGTSGASNTRQRTAWTMISNSRAFGVEMETYLPKRSDEFLLDNAVKAIRDVVPGLRTFLGPEYDVAFVDYQSAKDDRAYKAWKITTDLSIKSEDGRPIFGLEFITPKLSGPFDLFKVENFCDQLQAMNFSVNTSTALHVHVSVEDLSNYEILRICQYQCVFEHVIDQFMTLPRRADYSRYCRSNLKSLSPSRSVQEALDVLSKVKIDRSIGPLIRAYCPRLSAVRNSHRNHKVNLLLLNRTRQGTPGRRIEFRQHQGSVDKVEIGAWVTLLNNWVSKVSKMPPPNPTEGTSERFWAIIDDPKLRAYYTVKSQTLPSSMTFTYDSRELYAYESDEEEKSDIDDGTPPQTPQTEAVSAREALTSPVPPPSVHVLAPAPPPTARDVAFGRDAFNSPAGSPSTSATRGAELQTLTPATSERVTMDITFAGVEPLKSDSGEGMKKRSNDPEGHLGTKKNWEAGEMSISSFSTDQPMQIMQKQLRRHRGSVAVGNFVLPLPLHIETELQTEAGDSWESLTSTDPEIICSQHEDVNDNTGWYITAPTGSVVDSLGGGRRGALEGVRWVSPWLLEAKKLEMISSVQDCIKESLLVEDIFRCTISINLSSFSNAEVAQVICGVLVFENTLALLLNDSSAVTQSGVTKDTKVFSKIVAEVLRLGSVAGAFPKTVLAIATKVISTKFFDMQDVVETTQPSKGNFSLRRALRFRVSTGSAADLANRCMFLSYMCNHFGKKCRDQDMVRIAEVVKSPNRKDLVDFVVSLPASVQRTLV